MTINERIRALRKELKLTQKDFGTRIGLKHGTVSWMEKDGNSIIDQNISFICNAFHVNEQWLRSGEGDMYAENDDILLNQITEHYKLTPDQQALIRSFLELTTDQRDAVVYSVCRAADAIRQSHQSSVPSEQSEEERLEAQRAKAHELLDQELDAEQEDAEVSRSIANGKKA